MKKAGKTFLLLAALAVTGVLATAGQRVTGTWALVPTLSNFGGQAVVQSGTVTINSREGNIYIARNFTFEGSNQTFWYNFSTDGREGATIKSKERNSKSKAKWDDGALKVVTTDDNGTTVEYYKLQADGSMMLNLERPGKSPVTMVFNRAPGSQP
ncbi:MAG: hypothetical protein SGI92_23015 [Bryobacteraceae bacterium]|nr:hypothetical protein [Bryobacteraceae bacterium]